MQKSKTLRDLLVRKLSHRVHVDETVVDAVISHQFESLHLAMQSNDTVELSGFGKFIWKTNACQRKIDSTDRRIGELHARLLEENVDQKVVKKIKTTMVELMKRKQTLIDKINGKVSTDLRGLEEQFDPRGIDEGFDTTDLE